MDYHTVLGYLMSALVPLLIFIALLIYAMVRGRRSITSIILGLYFALLISLKFPYYERIDKAVGGVVTDQAVAIIIFVVFTAIAAVLMDRLLFYRVDEGAFQGFGKKFLLALMATILVMAYSYHVLPITNLVNPGLPASVLFAPDAYFFWWLIVPFVGLFFV